MGKLPTSKAGNLRSRTVSGTAEPAGSSQGNSPGQENSIFLLDNGGKKQV